MSSTSETSRLRVPIQQPWSLRISRGRRVLVSFAVTASVFLSGGVLDWLVSHQHLPRISLMLAGAAVALAVGILVFQILTDVQKRYQAVVDRLRVIKELNHHIRNALQVIVFTNVPERSEQVIQQVDTAIIRIDSILREVLPERKI